MKDLTSRIIICLALFFIIQNHFATIENAYGENKTIKPATPDPFLKPENNVDHISEANILFTIDKTDIEFATEKKSKSKLAQELIAEYLKKGKKI